jgi:hypothetical protein
MQWNHLPMPGGLYDQHPELLDRFMYIFQERNKEERKKNAQREAEMKRKSGRRG